MENDSIDTFNAAEQLENEFKSICITKMQSFLRKARIRRMVYQLVNERYEKIYDPKLKRYYYYDTVKDKSSWRKPLLLKNNDIAQVSATYGDDEAAMLIQNFARIYFSKRKVRLLYRDNISVIHDDSTNSDYYHNPKTGFTSWSLPEFMGGKVDHAYKLHDKKKKKKKLKKGAKSSKSSKSSKLSALKKSKSKLAVESDDDDDDDDEGEGNEGESDQDDSGDDSDLSETSDVIIAKRRDLRIFPRSKAQALVDTVEDEHHTVTVCSLDLSNLGATRFTSRVYDLTKLTTLVLKNNKLTKLSQNIQYLVNLTLLDVSFNQLTTLPTEIEELVNLKMFYAQNNLISTYPSRFYKLSKLEVLDFSNNPLVAIPMEVGNLELLKELEVWEVGLGLLTSLTTLEAENAKLSVWPLQLEQLVKLKHLNLSHNAITVVPGLLIDNRQLTNLNLSFNELSSLPIDFLMLPIKILKLDHNSIIDLPVWHSTSETKHPVSSITELDISHNKLTNLNSTIGNMSSLKILNASNNEISSIPDEVFSSLTLINSMDLSHNLLTELPQSIGSCRLLDILHVNHNKITEMPTTMSQLKHLTDLNFAHNQLTECSGKVSAFLTSLRTLDISYNTINKLPLSLYGVSKLQSLNCSHNEITSLNPKIGMLVSLTSLDCSFNRIDEIPSEISTVKQLKMLDFTSNHLFDLPDSLTLLTGLTRVALSHNKFTEIPTMLELLPALMSWNLSWNELVKSNAVDWRTVDKLYNSAEEAIPLSCLRRKLFKAWEKLSTANESYATNTSLSQTAYSASLVMASPLLGKEAKIAAKKLSKAKDKLHQSMTEVNNWHQKLRKYFEQQRLFERNPIIVPAVLPPPDAAPATTSPTAKSPKTDGRKNLPGSGKVSGKEKSPPKLSRASHDLTLAVSEKPAMSSTKCYVRSAKNDIAPEIDFLALEKHLGGTVPREMSDEGVDKLTEIAMVAMERRKTKLQFLFLRRKCGFPDEPELIELDDTIPDASIIEGLDLGADYQRSIELFEQAAHEISLLGLMDWANIKIRKAKATAQKKDDSASEALLQTALGLPTPTPAEHNKIAHSLTWRDALLLMNGLSVRKSLIIDFTTKPMVFHFPRLGASSSSQLFHIALDCYLGLGTALVKRAEKVARAIRIVEKRGKIKISCLNVAQRQENDFSDFVEDESSTLIAQIAAQNKALASLNEKTENKAKFAAVMKQASVVGVDTSDGQDTTAGPELPRKVATKGRVAPPVIVHKSIEEIAAEMGNIPHSIAKCTVQYLRIIRQHLLLWAVKILDSTSEALQECGWGKSFPPISRIGDFVDSNAADLRSKVIHLGLVRGRAYQSLNQFDKSIEEFSTVRALAPNFQGVQVEIVKSLLAKGDFVKGKLLLLGVIRRECPAIEDSKLDDSSVVFRNNPRLGLLLMYAEVFKEQLDKHHVGSLEQIRVHSCRSDGLLTQAPVLSRELKVGLPLNSKRLLAEYQQNHEAKLVNLRDVDSREALQARVASLLAKSRQALSDSKTMLETKV